MNQNPDPHQAQQSERPRLMRAEGPRRSEVAPIELFFDLVYVFAIIQVSHTLLADLSWTGVAQVAVLFGAVWWAWNYSAWAMNWLDPHSGLVRVLNGLLMLAALGMSLGLPHAFAEDGLLFAACYVSAQVGRAAFMAVALRGTCSRRTTRTCWPGAPRRECSSSWGRFSSPVRGWSSGWSR